ncbi:unnamed protein product [Heterobilharzia americana]|nr:unnamed protein product [Heterobilharzia americana]
MILILVEIGSHCTKEILRCSWGHDDSHSKTQCARGCRLDDRSRLLILQLTVWRLHFHSICSRKFLTLQCDTFSSPLQSGQPW